MPGRLISRTPPFEGGRAGASPAPAANFNLRVLIYDLRAAVRNEIARVNRHSEIVTSQTLGGEIASRLVYTQKSEGQNLSERPAFAQLSFGSACQFALWCNQERAGL
jgi:hypothetical protein